MNESEMLHKMCHEVLSEADVKAVRKSRGFSAQETATRALFENFFLSETGAEAALRSLTGDEALLLHLLSCLDEPVDLECFARVYGKGMPSWGTFSNQFKGVLTQVKKNLVRKGVLLMADSVKGWTNEPQMDRWRFRFPKSFERLLPPPFGPPKRSDAPGQVRTEVSRRKLLELVGETQTDPKGLEGQHELCLSDGEVRMGSRRFSAESILSWQQACWLTSISGKGTTTRREGPTVSPVIAVPYLLGRLAEHEWLAADELSLPLKALTNSKLTGDDICASGWEWGCLARQELDGVRCYRLPDRGAEDDTDPGEYLTVSSRQPLKADLETIPFQALASLGQIASLAVARSKHGHLSAVPSIVKMGNASESVLGSPLVQWLNAKAPAFTDALRTVAQRRGKNVVHENLLIARVGDLSLKFDIEKALGDKVVALAEDYIAFPTQSLPSVEKLVKQSGHVIKTVKCSE